MPENDAKKEGPVDEFRSASFFTADVCGAVDYVTDIAGAHRDRKHFIAAVIKDLKAWAEKVES